MDGRIDEMAATVAAMTRAAGTALDPSTILARTLTALAPAVAVAGATLWLGEDDDLHRAAAFPDDHVDPDGHLVPLTGADRPIGQLTVSPPVGVTFTEVDRALLEIAGAQIAGALERGRLFQEVMELERLKSDFIARVSHELRTPITIINGFLETLIAHDSTLDAEQRLHMLERSRVASSRLGHLIEELLILSRLEGGVLTPHPERLVMADVLESVRAGAAEPDQVLVTGPLDHPVVTDRSLLTRALGLLVDNAIKYGGVAELSTRVEPGRWIVEVRDRGPGFADDIRTTAFEMFARSQTTASVPGLGAGLAIARTLVGVLDGEVTIGDATPGPGAVARISLPA
jgi:signal transduction histidine kinase